MNYLGCRKMSAKILVIEDDTGLRRLLQLDLEKHQYDVATAADGQSGLRLFENAAPDLVVLDIAMPVMDGWEVCRRLRLQSNVPILMMTAHAINEQDIAHGLNMGADEYMVKPLSGVEFHARVNALLRRAQLSNHEQTEINRYADDYMQIDINSRQVKIEGQEVRLTPTEFNLLALFIRNNGDVLTFQEILEKVWGPEYKNEHHYPRIYVSHLRRKIEPDYKNPTYIHNEYGVGYIFNGRERT